MNIQWNITQGLVCCGETFIGLEIKVSNLERDLVNGLQVNGEGGVWPQVF